MPRSIKVDFEKAFSHARRENDEKTSSCVCVQVVLLCVLIILSTTVYRCTVVCVNKK
jgi:hypothetical protein